jgi:methyl-accepting chemotaxis protein
MAAKSVKISTKIVALSLVAITTMLAIVVSLCLVSFDKELKRIASENQQVRLKVFWALLGSKGSEFRIQDDKLMAGDYVISGNFELPDKVKELCGGTATVFMRDTRVSTTVVKPDGTRAVGTKLTGPAYDAIFKNDRPYRGETKILGVPCFTAYDPIKNASGETIGVLYAGVKKSEFFASYDKLKLGILLLSLLLGALVAAGVYAMVRWVFTRPIELFGRRLQEIIREGEVDLTRRIGFERDDEIGRLAGVFDGFLGNLEEIITRVKSTAVQVDEAMEEVASGSQTVSSATQEQASTVEEVAATLEQMSHTIRQNAAKTDQGREMARTSANMANASGEASQELSGAMGEISRSSQKIGDIIVTVNEVAFQTNLLALNAAVEAARAGEHGRGFAVVASEVRTLAQRSADAAREIKHIVEETTSKIGAGEEIVRNSVEGLQQMVIHINDLSQTIEGIARASSEQAGAVDEVNKAISQIDRATQQNAATVASLSGTAETLKEEARTLAETVNLFKVSGDDRLAA